ncbi:MAG: DUF6502 family protein [Gammaproteobacteria bacterium]
MAASQELHDVFQLRRPVTRFLVSVLRPIICIMIRLGVSSYAVTEIVRWLYVDIAMRNPECAPGKGQMQTKSRAALLTGLSRREVLRLDSMPNPDSGALLSNYSRIARVVSGWLLDTRYSSGKDKPLDLPVKASRGPSFFGLVNDYAGDIPYRTVLDELIRVGLVEERRDGSLKLIKKALLQNISDDKALIDAGDFAEKLLLVLEKDIQKPEKSGKPYRLVHVQRVSPEKADRLHDQLVGETSRFISRLGKLVDDSSSGKKRRAGNKETGVGVFYFKK